MTIKTNMVMKRGSVLHLGRLHATKMWSVVSECYKPSLQSSAIHANKWNMDTIVDVLFACCILYNMICNDEHDVHGLKNVLGATTID